MSKLITAVLSQTHNILSGWETQREEQYAISSWKTPQSSQLITFSLKATQYGTFSLLRFFALIWVWLRWQKKSVERRARVVSSRVPEDGDDTIDRLTEHLMDWRDRPNTGSKHYFRPRSNSSSKKSSLAFPTIVSISMLKFASGPTPSLRCDNQRWVIAISLWLGIVHNAGKARGLNDLVIYNFLKYQKNMVASNCVNLTSPSYYDPRSFISYHAGFNPQSDQ